MWTNFFAAGGWGMYPTSLFGFLLIAAAVLHALRPAPKSARLVFAMGILTLAAGTLGALTGIANSLHYLPQAPRAEQLELLALGCEESLHDAVLALMLTIVGCLVASIGTLRGPREPAANAAAR